MRTTLLLASVLSLALFACGGDGDKDGTATNSNDDPGKSTSGGPAEPGGGESTTPGSTSSPDDQNGSSPTTPSPSGNTPGGNGSNGTPPPAGTTPTPTPGGTGQVPASAACEADSLKEVESNDTPETATEFATATSFCGTIAGTDVDHLTFTLPAEAKGFGWKQSWKGKGTPTMTITAKGVTKTSNENPPFFPGEKYVIKVMPGADPADYVVALNITK
jgi:hypothetical protein